MPINKQMSKICPLSKIKERPIIPLEEKMRKGTLARDQIATMLRRLSFSLLPNGKRFGAEFGESTIITLCEKGILSINAKSLETLTFDMVNPNTKTSTLRAFVTQFKQEHPEIKLEFKNNKLRIAPFAPQIQDNGKNFQVTVPVGPGSYVIPTPQGQVHITVTQPEKESIYKTIVNSPDGLDEAALLEQTGLERIVLYNLIGELGRSRKIRGMPHLKNGKFTLRYRTVEQIKELYREGKTYSCVDENLFHFSIESKHELNSGAVVPAIAGDNLTYYHSAEAFQKIKAEDEKERSPNRHFAVFLDRNGNENVIYTNVAERWIFEGRAAPALDNKGLLQVIDLELASEYQDRITSYYVKEMLRHIDYNRKLTVEGQRLIELAAKHCLENYSGKKIKGRIPVLNHCLSDAAIAASLGADPITVTATLLHKEEKLSKAVIKLKRGVPGLKEELNDLPILIEGLKKAVRQLYWPPETTGKKKRKPKYHIQNHIDMILNLTRHPDRRDPKKMVHDHRVMLMIFADKLDEVQTMTQLPSSPIARENLYKEIRHIFAALADRFFFSELYYKFLNQILRMCYPEEFFETQSAVRDEYKDPPHKIQALMEKMEKALLRKALRSKRYGKEVSASFRQKFEQSSYEKMGERDFKNEYANEEGKKFIGRISDLIAGRLVMLRKIYNINEAQNLVLQSLDKFIKYHIEAKTETKEKTGAHHICFRDKKERAVEVQVMSNKEYKEYMISGAPHWAFKLEELTGQAFDIESIRKYADKITGEFEKDFYVVTQPLQAVVIVNYIDENGEKRLRRLRRGSIPVDLAASRTINALNENYAGVEIAGEFGWNKEGKPIYRNWRPVPESYEFKDGDVVRFVKSGKKKLKSPEARRNAALKSTNLRAKVLLTLWEKEEFNKKIKKGREQADKTKLFKKINQNEISAHVHRFGFANINEFYVAYAVPELRMALIAEQVAENETFKKFIEKLGKTGEKV